MRPSRSLLAIAVAAGTLGLDYYPGGKYVDWVAAAKDVLKSKIDGAEFMPVPPEFRGKNN